jgi:hypothetical protein
MHASLKLGQMVSQVSEMEFEKIIRGNAIEMLGLDDSLPTHAKA